LKPLGYRRRHQRGRLRALSAHHRHGNRPAQRDRFGRFLSGRSGRSVPVSDQAGKGCVWFCGFGMWATRWDDYYVSTAVGALAYPHQTAIGMRLPNAW
jgi:hypothetical protein